MTEDTAEPPTQAGATVRRRIAYVLVALAVLAADQYTKRLVSERMAIHQSVPVVDGFFHLTYVRNRGAAFGILSERDSRFKDVLFYATSALAFLVLAYNAITAPVAKARLQIGLYLVLGGAIGNLVDRLRFGSVVDFLDVHYRNWVWPTFNLADSCICIGIGLMAWELLKSSPAAAPDAALSGGEVRG